MARIRSVHPGLFTDEGFVSCGAFARLLIIGIWTECDDQGVFEWKPLTLKMRLMPADAVDVSELLGELETNNLCQRFTHDGKQYGIVRNFQKYQRPKKPNAIHPLPHEFRAYVGATDESSEPVPHQFPTSGEKSPQMEDGGGREEGKKKEKTAAGRGGSPYAFVGKVIKLKPDDLEAWRKRYSAIPDIEAELASLDDFYASDRCTDSERRNWYIRASKALDNRHQEQILRRKREATPRTSVAI